MKRHPWLVLLVLLAIGPASAGAAGKATVTVENQTSYTLVEMNRATEVEIDWSLDLLGKSTSVRPERKRDITVDPGYTWLRAVFDVDGTEVEVVETADFEDGGVYVWTITEDMLGEAYDAAFGEDTYGYYDDTYGYYDDTYGYY